MTDPWEDGLFLWAEAPFLPTEVEIDCELQLRLGPTEYRRAPLPDGLTLLDSVSLLRLPQEYQGTGLEFQLALLVSEVVTLEIWVMTGGCLEDRLNELEGKLNLLLADKTLRTILDIAIPLLTAGTGSLLVPAVAAGLRGVVSVLNPSSVGELLIGFGREPTVTDWDFRLAPGDLLQIDDWAGDVFARPIGDSIQPIVKELVP